MQPEPLEVLVRCDCLDVRHVVALQVYGEPDPCPSAFLSVTAAPWGSLWDRLVAAFSYVFRRHELSYASVCLTRKTARQLRAGLDEFLATSGPTWPHEEEVPDAP